MDTHLTNCRVQYRVNFLVFQEMISITEQCLGDLASCGGDWSLGWGWEGGGGGMDCCFQSCVSG